MHKQNFAMQPRDWPTTSEEAWRFDENLQATGRPSTASNGQNKLLHLGSSSAMIRRFGRRMSVRTIQTASGRLILVFMNACWKFSFRVQHVFTIFPYNAVVLESHSFFYYSEMMSHLLLRYKSLMRSRNWRLCSQRPSQNTCFSSEIDLIMKCPSLLHDSSERCLSMISFPCIRLYHPVVLLQNLL